MAKRPSAKRPKDEDADKPLISPIMIAVLAASLLILLFFYSPESLPLLGIGMLPTVGAALTGYKAKGVWVTVGWLNFAGLASWLLDLWSSDHTLSYATHQLRTITPVLAAYAGAVGGWALYWMMPSVTAVFIAASSKRRRTNLVAKQQKLVERWDRGIVDMKAMILPASTPKTQGAAASAPPVPGKSISAMPARGRAYVGKPISRHWSSFDINGLR